MSKVKSYIKCDFCDKEIEPFHARLHVVGFNVKMGEKKTKVDMCQKCINEFVGWMEERKNEQR